MIYETSQPFSGDAKKSLDYLVQTLTAGGFRIERRTESTLSARGPGPRQSSTHPLAGVGQLEILAAPGVLAARAGLRSVDRAFWSLVGILGIFAAMFIVLPALVLIFPSHFSQAVRFHNGHPAPRWRLGLVMVIGLIPLVFLPQMRAYLLTAAGRGVDGLLLSAAAAGEDSQTPATPA